MKKSMFLFIISVIVLFVFYSSNCLAQSQLPSYLNDRGTGLPTSMFGAYINKGEFIAYSYYEYYHDNDAEYKPAEFGYGLDQDSSKVLTGAL